MSQVNVNTIRSRQGLAPSLDRGTVVTGVCTADTFKGDFSGNIVGTAATFTTVSISGTMTHEDVTNVDSVGIVTGGLGVRVLSGGIQAVGFYTGLSASGVATLGGNVSVGGSISFGDGLAKGAFWGADEDLAIYHDGSHSYINDGGTGALKISTNELQLLNAAGNEYFVSGVENGAVNLYYDNSVKVATINQGIVVTGITSTTQLSVGPGVLRESYNEYGSALNGTYNQDVLTTGMSLYSSSNATATFVINLRGNGSTTFNSLIKEGESTIFTLYHGSNNTSYYLTDFQIDGSSITEEWSGGSAPSAATGSGFDVYTFNILKTGNAAFKVFSNVANFD